MFGLFKKKEKEGSCGTQTGSCGSSMKAEKSSCGSGMKVAQSSCSIDAKPKGSCGSSQSHHHHDDEGDCSKPKGCC